MITPHLSRDEFRDEEEEDDWDGASSTDRPLPASWSQPVAFCHYDVLQTVQYLLSQTDLTDDFDVAPCMIINDEGNRVISDFFTADWAHQLQVRRVHFKCRIGTATDHLDVAQKKIPLGKTLVPLIASSDETNLTAMC